MEKTAQLLFTDVDNKTIFVLCPYCDRPHKHGYVETSDISGSYRGSHCGMGEYKIYGTFDFASVQQAIKRRDYDIQLKRRLRAEKKEKKTPVKEIIISKDSNLKV